jgi:hypothetical protein
MVECFPVGLPAPAAGIRFRDWLNGPKKKDRLNIVENATTTTSFSSSRQNLVHTPPQTGATPAPPPPPALQGFPPTLHQSIPDG